MISVHNVPYVLKCIRYVLPAHVSGSNSVSCPATSLICIPHFFYNSDLLHKQTGPSPGKTSSGPCHAEVLTGRTAGNDVYRRQVGAVEFCDVPDMEHIREPQSSDFNGKRLDLARPQRCDTVVERRQREASDPIKETSQGGHLFTSAQSILRPLPPALLCEWY